MSTLTFLRDVLRRPLEMGAVLPSSPALAQRMVDAAEIGPDHVVLELGAGSGSFTAEIVARHPDNRLVLVEPGPDLAAALRWRFPRALVTTSRAEDLGRSVEELRLARVDRIVSGLPRALWTADRQRAVLDAVVPLLNPSARLVTFHYVHSRALGRVSALRHALEERFESVTQTEPVWANVPPAFVHVASLPRTQ